MPAVRAGGSDDGAPTIFVGTRTSWPRLSRLSSSELRSRRERTQLITGGATWKRIGGVGLAALVVWVFVFQALYRRGY